MSAEIVASKGVLIWNQIITILNAAKALDPSIPGNLAYVKSIWQGYRDNVPSSAMPAIIMEIVKEIEHEHSIPLMKKMTLVISIGCWSTNFGTDKQITGDAASIGIMDFSRDVKNAINADPDLLKAGTICGSIIILILTFY